MSALTGYTQALKASLAPHGEARLALTLLSLTALIATSVGALLTTRALTSAPEPPAWAPLYQEGFDHPSLLERLTRSSADQGFESAQDAWQIKEGRLWGRGGHNSALWFPFKLPSQARVELSARAESEAGDVKCELFGDGHTHQSGYIVINGGWQNSLRVIARQDEHAEERREDNRCARRCAPQGQEQRWVIERRDGVLSWYLDGQLALRLDDPHPLQGTGFALNHWEAPVSFDDLVVYDLSSPPSLAQPSLAQPSLAQPSLAQPSVKAVIEPATP